MDSMPDFGREVDSDDDGKAGKELVRDLDLQYEETSYFLEVHYHLVPLRCLSINAVLAVGSLLSLQNEDEDEDEDDDEAAQRRAEEGE